MRLAFAGGPAVVATIKGLHRHESLHMTDDSTLNEAERKVRDHLNGKLGSLSTFWSPE